MYLKYSEHDACHLVFHREKHSNFKQCDTAQCCSVHQEEILVAGESFTATVWKGGDRIESKIINVTDSSKLTSLK